MVSPLLVTSVLVGSAVVLLDALIVMPFRCRRCWATLRLPPSPEGSKLWPFPLFRT